MTLRLVSRAASLCVALALSAALLDASAVTTGALSSTGSHAGVVARAAGPLPELPRGGRQVFPDYILVAYYGTAQTPALGVLGEGSIDEMTRRLRAAARPYRHSGRRVQIVYELIVSVADRKPGPDGNYSHYIPRAYVERFVNAARRNKALLVLDLQPGRQSFLTQANQFRWALREPFVGLALDPEWRMGPNQVPAETIGSVSAAEVNATSSMVAQITRRFNLPEKVFVVHQFRREMVRNIHNVIVRPPLAMVQHIDGFGSRRAKLATYHHVRRSDKFHMGFKLFYDEDTNLFAPRHVLSIRPRVEYVSYQ